MTSSETHKLERSASSIAVELWSPDELYNVDAPVDVLQPSLKVLNLDSRRFYAFRASLLLTPFEVLEEYWAPEQERMGQLSDNGAVEVGCREMFWDGRPDGSTPGSIAEKSKASSWFRFSTTVCHRTFVVDRVAAQVETLVAALRYTFPPFLIPASSEISESLCSVLVEVIKRHWSTLSSFFPLLYFLFEVQERKFLAFYKQLGALLQTKRANDKAACDALRPKKGGKMFSWFSSKTKDAELGVNDKLEIISDHKDALPPSFDRTYMLTLARQEQVLKLQLFCREFVSSLRAEKSAYQATAEGVAAYPLHSFDVPGWYSSSGAESRAVDDASVRQVTLSVQRFALRKASLADELLLPVLAAIEQCEQEAGTFATAHVAYLEDLVMRTKTVSENALLLTGKLPLPTGCDASLRPDSMATAKDVHQRYTRELQEWRQLLDGEVSYARDAVEKRLRRLCVLCGDSFLTIASLTKGDYYMEYLRSSSTFAASQEAATEPTHPLLVCLGNEDTSESRTHGIDRECA